MKNYILQGFTLDKVSASVGMIAELYDEYGVVVFPGLLSEDRTFNAFLRDLKKVMARVIKRHTNDELPEDMGDMLVKLTQLQPLDGKILTDLGTQPNKFFYFNQLKYSPWIGQIMEGIFGEQAICVTPQAGDTLHFFSPGNAFRRYNLPCHQDYQYLMQSPRQITFYLGLSQYRPEVGGLRIWEKSHKLGILQTTKSETGAFEVLDAEKALEGYEEFDYTWNVGDFGLFDSLLVHSSIPNTSQNYGRVVQIFRESDINDKTAESFNYYSATYERRGVHFVEHHRDLFTPPPAAKT